MPDTKPETKEPKRRGPKPLPPNKLKHREVFYLTDTEAQQVRDYIAQIRRPKTMFTYTEIEASELKALDLLREYGNSDEHAVIARVTIDDKPEAAEVLFFPMIQRAGIAWGADAQWTDALTLEEAIYRFLNDEMVN